ncbi:hypothetical protein BKA69DRAFT_1094940 [Paraphysoderma sedebokerense]|nr:hypothetical protein BKA69DRAFT_1094940 [Paraphysoderma sedebokerense]
MSSDECALLAQLHNALDPVGGVLPRWTTTVPPGGFVNGSCCTWQSAVNGGFTIGVSCDPTQQTVTFLRLSGLNNWGWGLRGTIPPDIIGKFTGLRGLELGVSPLVGTLPPQLGNLTLLTVLNLQGVSISGAFPSEIATLSNLRSLYLDNNKITELPRNFGSLSSLVLCSLANLQVTCRPEPFPAACSRQTNNLPINNLPLCPPFTSATTTTATIATETMSEFLTTASINVGPTSTQTNTWVSNSNTDAAAAVAKQRYTVFGSLLSIIITVAFVLSVLRRRLNRRLKNSPRYPSKVESVKQSNIGG